MEETSIRFAGDFTDPLGVAMRQALAKALALDSKVPEAILQLPGMSGRLYRRFINLTIESIAAPRYLEIGSWAGSTACSAMLGNEMTITCIDNWSEFGGPKDLFHAHVGVVRSDKIDFRFIESDFRKVDFTTLGLFNVYLFDGPHAYQDQYDGIMIAQPALEPRYIQIVDDWNWPYVRAGTLDAIAAAGLEIVCSIEVRTTQDDTHPTKAVEQFSAWHNGYFMAVVQKASAAAG